MKAASALQHYDSVTTQTLTAKTFTKTFPLNYYGMTLLTLTNPNASAVAKPASAVKAMEAVAWRADIKSGKLMLTVPERGLYKVGLFTTGGRKMFESRDLYTGNVNLDLPKIPAGVYVIQCAGTNYSLVKQVAVRQ